jgi:hypothetical protein
VNRHLLSQAHLRKTKQIKVIAIDRNCKHQCKVCNKRYKSQQALWMHNVKCNEPVKRCNLQEEINELKSLVVELSNNQKNSITNHIINNNNINITNNIQIFLNEKCNNAMEMNEFICGIEFCAENFSKSNLLISNALEHTAQIFHNHLKKMTIYERPIHNFTGEDQNQMIAHYRHNNEWKVQSELSILDEIYRDYERNDPLDSLVYYLGMFHKRRLEYFNNNYGKKNSLGTNLRYTTYSEQQIDLARKLLDMSSIDPIKYSNVI